MPETTIQALREAIRGLHKCDSAFVESVPIRETFQGRVVWEGAVVVFDLIGHATATRAYAWSHETTGGKRRFVAVLREGKVDSPVAAVRASIVADRRALRNRMVTKEDSPRKPRRGKWRRGKFLDDHPGTEPPPIIF